MPNNSDSESMIMGVPSPCESSNNNQIDQSDTIDVERMDDEEDYSSNDSRFQLEANGKSTTAMTSRNPSCALCKNHGINSALKGHKRYCNFSGCPCHPCRVTRKKQKLNASQVSSRRAQQQDKELGVSYRSSIPTQNLSGSSTPRPFDSPIPSIMSTEPRRISNEQHHSQMERPSRILTLASANSSSRSLAPVSYTPALSGPVIFGENISLECFLLGRNASLLSNSLHDTRMSREQLQYLDNEISNTTRAVKDIAFGVNSIYQYLVDRLQREHVRSSKNNVESLNSHILVPASDPRAHSHLNNHSSQHQAHLETPMFQSFGNP